MGIRDYCHTSFLRNNSKKLNSVSQVLSEDKCDVILSSIAISKKILFSIFSSDYNKQTEGVRAWEKPVT